MVVLSQLALEPFSVIKTCKPIGLFSEIPVIDLTDPHAKTLIIKACEEFGFFKLVNHGVPMEVMTKLEALATNFFNLPQPEKDKAGPPNPFGYGNKKIGPNGDVGWVEYLLLNTNPQISSQKTSILQENPQIFRSAVEDYILAVKRMAFEVLELMADGLEIESRNVFSRLLRDDKSDSCFRLNHYPPCSELQALSGGNLIGFGEHTDPQIISVLKSNNTSGLQICLKEGTWVSVPPDQTSFFINVGDALQVCLLCVFILLVTMFFLPVIITVSVFCIDGISLDTPSTSSYGHLVFLFFFLFFLLKSNLANYQVSSKYAFKTQFYSCGPT
ncbi:hypothetical protein NC653_010784 [Populus alba x Populus x berolinensis]|uniref:gibberellin 2beta-dioxygenase n=1 Tax=Populus alba x Populus x berolinensis TaxID=444605 RepID=A0AAD6R0N2_9ROSI|nr:hypothetical protein NC653_010784 [Populus alba x Populus x berolinensis]